jgi:cytoskeletal protein CcmA (bactofilin family)
MRRIARSALVLLVLSGAAAAGLAQPATLAGLRADLEERFELIPLSDGVLLRAHDASGPRAVEVSGHTVALDGEPVGTDELRLRLGAEASELVLAVLDLDPDARQALLRATPEAVIEDAAEAEEAAAGAEEAAAGAEEARATAREAAEEARAAAEQLRQNVKKKRHRTGDSEVAFAGSITVEKDEVSDDVLVFGGFLKVEGRVEGEATVIGGSATISGEVTGDVTAVGGPVRLENGAHVHGDVVSVGAKVYRDAGARVDGDVEQVPFRTDMSFGPWGQWARGWSGHRHHDYDFDWNPWGWWTGMGWRLVKLLFFAGLAWIALLVARRPIERMERRVAREPWKTGLVGLLAQVLFFPMLIMLIVFLAISIIGIPLILVVVLALPVLVLIAWLGYVAVAGRVGGWVSRRFGWHVESPFWAVLIGLVLICSLSLVGNLLNFGVAPMRFVAGMFLFCGAIVSWAAWTIGFGAVVLTRFGSAESWSRAEQAVAPLPPVPSYDDQPDEALDAGGEPADWSDETLDDDES